MMTEEFDVFGDGMEDDEALERLFTVLQGGPPVPDALQESVLASIEAIEATEVRQALGWPRRAAMACAATFAAAVVGQAPLSIPLVVGFFAIGFAYSTGAARLIELAPA